MKRFVCVALVLGLTLGNLFAGGETEQGAAVGKPVMIYSPQTEDDIGYILAAAEEELDFDIEILRLGGGELADRLLAESNNPQADVVFGLVPLSMYHLKKEEVLTPYTPKWVAGLPGAYQDSEHYFHSFWQTPIVLAYNGDAMGAAEAPKSWLDLTQDKYVGKYAIGSTRGQTVRTYLSGILWRFFDLSTGEVAQEGWDFLRKLYANARENPEGEEYYQEVAVGTMPLVLNWFGGVEKGAKLNDINIVYVNTEGGTPVIAEAIALIRKDVVSDNAKAFIDWFGSADFQARMAHDLGKSPAHPTALANSPANIKAKLSFFTAQSIDWGVVVDNIDDWLEKIVL
ncbi:MAG: extracellular solute-binding protein, partial [Candidatus Thiodiazotropha sp.]|nr:extracellular solute-binding protein [Candidatus Thiodiazotropha sp.]